MTSVCPALWPPWKRTTISACSESQSTILPLPSSPHWAPTTTTLAMSCPSAVWPEMVANQQWSTQAPALPELSEATAAGKAAWAKHDPQTAADTQPGPPPLSLAWWGPESLMNQMTKRPSRGDTGATAPEYGAISKGFWKICRLQYGVCRNARIELSIHRHANAGPWVPPNLVIAATWSLELIPGIPQQ